MGENATQFKKPEIGWQKHPVLQMPDGTLAQCKHLTTNFPSMTLMLKSRAKCQCSANRLAGGKQVQFTAVCGWTSQEKRCQQHRMTQKCQLKQGISFHTWTLNLSGQLVWATNGDLQLRVHLKPN